MRLSKGAGKVFRGESRACRQPSAGVSAPRPPRQVTWKGHVSQGHAHSSPPVTHGPRRRRRRAPSTSRFREKHTTRRQTQVLPFEGGRGGDRALNPAGTCVTHVLCPLIPTWSRPVLGSGDRQLGSNRGSASHELCDSQRTPELL